MVTTSAEHLTVLGSIPKKCTATLVGSIRSGVQSPSLVDGVAMCRQRERSAKPYKKGSSQPLVPCVAPLKSSYSVTPTGGRGLLVVSTIELLVILGMGLKTIRPTEGQDTQHLALVG